MQPAPERPSDGAAPFAHFAVSPSTGEIRRRDTSHGRLLALVILGFILAIALVAVGVLAWLLL